VDFITGVTDVWLAGPPEGGTVVIGCYQQATVYRHFQKFATQHEIHVKNDISGYWIKAPVAGATLLPIKERTLSIERGMGQW